MNTSVVIGLSIILIAILVVGYSIFSKLRPNNRYFIATYKVDSEDSDIVGEIAFISQNGFPNGFELRSDVRSMLLQAKKKVEHPEKVLITQLLELKKKDYDDWTRESARKSKAGVSGESKE